MKDLSLPELIGIIDTCFCCLVSLTFLNDEASVSDSIEGIKSSYNDCVLYKKTVLILS